MKTIESRIAPNPKEAQIWVDLTEDPHGLVKKYWNGKEWVIKESNQSNDFAKLVEDIKSLKTCISELFEENAALKTNIDLLQQQCSNIHDIVTLANKLNTRVNKLEQFIVTE